MRIAIGDWVFEIDFPATEAYSTSEAAEHCDCAYCRNFYASVDGHYPELRSFLAQFGVNVEAPDALMPFERADGMDYDAFYSVHGKIISSGSLPIRIGNAEVHPGRFTHLQIDAHCDEPYFYLNITPIVLPWVLEEPMEEVISPANQPSFLRKMWNRFLKKGRNVPYS